MSAISLGTAGRQVRTVTEANAISFLGRDDARVLATPWLICYLEITARDAVRPLLSETEDTVGTDVNIRHLAAAPMGAEVSFEAEVVAVEDRRITFRVAARDVQDLLAEGTHERTIINVERFASKLRAKREALTGRTAMES